jgi:hypothetical protein
VHHLFRIVLIVICSIGIAVASLAAETVSYPEKDPLFAVEVPSGWKAKHENGAIKITAEVNAIFLLQHVDNVKDEETAQTALPELAALGGKQFKMENVKISDPGRPIRIGDFKGFITDGRGTDKHGNDTLWQVMIFAPKEGDYYLLSCWWTNDDTEKTAADRAGIFKSLKPVGPN